MIALERVQPLEVQPRKNEVGRGAATVERVVRADSTDHFEVERLFARYYATVFAIVNRRVQHHADAEDIVQSVFLKLAMNLPAAQERDVRRWLSRVAINASIDALRQRRLAWLPLVEGQSQHVSAESTYLQEAETRLVRAAIDQLPAPLKLVLQLSHIDGLTQQQIAHRTQTPLGTVKTRIRRGLALLRGTLDRSEYPSTVKRSR